MPVVSCSNASPRAMEGIGHETGGPNDEGVRGMAAWHRHVKGQSTIALRSTVGIIPQLVVQSEGILDQDREVLSCLSTRGPERGTHRSRSSPSGSEPSCYTGL